MVHVCGPFKVTDVESHTVIIDEDGVLHRVGTDRIPPAQESPKEDIKVTNADNGSLPKTAPTLNVIPKDAKRGYYDKHVK